MSNYTPLSEESKQAIKAAIKLKKPMDAHIFIESFLDTGKAVKGFEESADFVFARDLLDDVFDLYIEQGHTHYARKILEVKLSRLPKSATEERLKTCQKLDAVADIHIARGYVGNARATLALKLSHLPESATEERLRTCQKYDAVVDLYITQGDAHYARYTLQEKFSRLSKDVAEKEKTRERLQQLGENNIKLQDMVKNFLVDTQTAPLQKLIP